MPRSEDVLLVEDRRLVDDFSEFGPAYVLLRGALDDFGMTSDLDDGLLVLVDFFPMPALTTLELTAGMVEAAGVTLDSLVEVPPIAATEAGSWYTFNHSISQYAFAKAFGLLATKSQQLVIPSAPSVIGHVVPPYVFPA